MFCSKGKHWAVYVGQHLYVRQYALTKPGSGLIALQSVATVMFCC
jgi:hypothetical protein